jgi:hypothetical protein
MHLTRLADSILHYHDRATAESFFHSGLGFSASERGATGEDSGGVIGIIGGGVYVIPYRDKATTVSSASG